MGLQTIVSRRVNLLEAPAVITVAMVHGGVRNNIIPEEVKLEGTIRSLDPAHQQLIHEEIRKVATNIAESAGAIADVEIIVGYPVTYNDPELTAQMAPTLEATAGKGNAEVRLPVTGAEDFSFFAREVPGLFFFLGGMPAGMDEAKAPAHHTPEFYVDDSGLNLGVRALCNLTLDYMKMHQEAGK
jgi:metal-dependent amidase/aminoacylase/carboxypeptidase family protein